MSNGTLVKFSGDFEGDSFSSAQEAAVKALAKVDLDARKRVIHVKFVPAFDESEEDTYVASVYLEGTV